MKRYIYIVSLLISIPFGVLAQDKPNERECDFLGPLHFKNGKATVVIKVIYEEFYRSGDEPLFKALAKKKKLNYHDYFRDCCGGSAIGFIPENCSKRYSGVMIQKRMDFDINKAEQGDTLYLTCIVFEGEKYYDKNPLFTVNNISLKK